MAEARRHELEQKLEAELVAPCFIDEDVPFYEIKETVERLKDNLKLPIPDKGIKMRARLNSFEREMRKRQEHSSSTSPPQVPQLTYKQIFITLPPHLRWAYNKMQMEICSCLYQLKYDTKDSEIESKVYSLILKMRKLCVDFHLAKLEETPILTFLESISGWDAAPKLALNIDQQPYCRKCGCYSDVLLTTCDHPLCLKCIVECLCSENYVRCHVCHGEVKAADSWMVQSTPSKFNTLMQLLIEDKDKCKSIVLCEFRNPLLKLQSALRLHNIRGKSCTTKTNDTLKEIRVQKFCNRSDITILFTTLDQLDFLSQHDLGCFSKMYIMSAIPIALVQQAIALIRGPQRVEVFKVTSHTTVEREIMGNDTGHLEEGNLTFTIEELRRLFRLG